MTNPQAVFGHSSCILALPDGICHDNSNTPAPAAQTKEAAFDGDHGEGLHSLLHTHAAALRLLQCGARLAALYAIETYRPPVAVCASCCNCLM